MKCKYKMRRSRCHTATDHQGELCKELWHLRSEGVMCDVVFDVGGEELHAHRIILSACSPYLKTYCINPTTMSQDGLVQIKVEGYSYKVCLKLIEFLYTGRVVKLDSSPPQEFRQLCTEWQIGGVTAETGIDKDFHADSGMDEVSLPDDSELGNTGKLSDASEQRGSALAQPDISREGASTRAVTTIVHSTTKGQSAERRVQKRHSPQDLVSGKKSRLTQNIKAQTQKNHSPNLDATDGALAPPLLAEEWVSSCLKDEGNPFDADTDSDGLRDRGTDNSDLDYKPSTTNNPEPHKRDSSQLDIDHVQSESKPTSNTDLKPEFPDQEESQTEQSPALAVGECNYCGDLFETPGDLQLHKKEVHKRRKDGWCRLCKPKQRFPEKNLLRLHMVKSHWVEGMEPPKLFACEECDYTTYSAATKRWHRRTRHPRPEKNPKLGPVECHICSALFHTPDELEIHKKDEHKSRRQGWCKICRPPRRFPDKNQLMVHQVSDHYVEGMPLPKLFSCEKCTYTTYCSRTMTWHSKNVHTTNLRICDVCGKALKTPYSLKMHKQMVHEETDSAYPCDKCGKVLKNKAGLVSHCLKLHTERDRQVCPQCGYSVLNRSAMIQHMYKQHDVAPPRLINAYKCKFCDYKCTGKTSINEHERRHNPEKQFACAECPKWFSTKNMLHQHRRQAHSKESKDYKCEQCDYSTKYGKSALRLHVINKHEDNRPYTCTICPYRTKVKGNLHKHIRNVHKCEVKTNWTVPKFKEGTVIDRYTNATHKPNPVGPGVTPTVTNFNTAIPTVNPAGTGVNNTEPDVNAHYTAQGSTELTEQQCSVGHASVNSSAHGGLGYTQRFMEGTLAATSSEGMYRFAAHHIEQSINMDEVHAMSMDYTGMLVMNSKPQI